ncbi:unnamed protein product, partial [Iphiclides podalirius]
MRSFQLLNENIEVFGNYDKNSKSYTWLIKEVQPQIVKWKEQYLSNNTNKSMAVKDSLILVPLSRYYTKYNELKLKYGKEMVKIWPENTDPIKFVYEDVAIATYLLLLWDEKQTSQSEHTKKAVNFVDVGCGNGLLVYILTKEGHRGLGVDVRKRKIWDMYEDNINLQENTVTPENLQMFAEYDWIIGNHSDELTPWIPVIATLSSYTCNFLLLPCCAYNFNEADNEKPNITTSDSTHTHESNAEPEDKWLIRECDIYKEEYKECTSFRGRFQQYFVYGELQDCKQWKKDYDNCCKWEDYKELKAAEALIKSEKNRRMERLRAHYRNDTWKKRESPPADWDKPLPEWMAKRDENTYLAYKSKEMKEGVSEKDKNGVCAIM